MSVGAGFATCFGFAAAGFAEARFAGTAFAFFGFGAGEAGALLRFAVFRAPFFAFFAFFAEVVFFAARALVRVGLRRAAAVAFLDFCFLRAFFFLAAMSFSFELPDVQAINERLSARPSHAVTARDRDHQVIARMEDGLFGNHGF